MAQSEYPEIMIIRHGEKPKDDKNTHLSAQGKRRAIALVGLFGHGGRLAGADYLIAADESKHSNRSLETLRPLARALNMEVDQHFEDGEYKALAKRLKSASKYRGAVVLIAWHHGNIPNLAMALGIPKRSLPLREWPDDVFDRIWIVNYDALGSAKILSGLQQVDVS